MKLASVAGSSSSDEAKIGGMTPEVLSFSGRCEASPPNILLPTWRFGYCTRMRRCARSMKTMKVTTPTAMSRNRTMKMPESAPVRPSSRSAAKADGMRATMPEKMMSEMPLPTPRAVICSPSHIRKMVPPVRVTTVVRRKKMPGSTTARPEGAAQALSSPTAMP